MATGSGGERPESPDIAAKVEIVRAGETGYLAMELVEGEPVPGPLVMPTAPLPRPTGRHRMPATLPAWLPDRPTTVAFLRHWWMAVLSGALIVVSVVTVAVVLMTRDRDRPAAAEPAGAVPAASAPTSEPAEPAPTSAVPTTSPSPSGAPRRPPASPIDRIAAVAVTAQQLIDSGDLDPRAGREVLRTLASATTAVRGGRTERAAERLRQLDKRLVELRKDGKLSRTGFEALDVLQPIIASLR